MLCGSNCPFACSSRFAYGTTGRHDGSCEIDPISGAENHLPVKGLFYSVEEIWQPCTISPVYDPVLRHFPVVFPNVSDGYGNDGPFFVTTIAYFRRPPTNRTRAFEVVALKEELLTFVRNRSRLQNTLEIGDRDLFACGDGAQRSDFPRECRTIPSEYRIWTTAGGASFVSTRTDTTERRGNTAPVIKTREGFENGRVKNVMTWHARNKERVGGYDTQRVVRIRRVAIVQRRECSTLIRHHCVRRGAH